MAKDIVEQLQKIAGIKDATSIPPEYLDNAVFLGVIKDAVREIQVLRLQAAQWVYPTTTTTANTYTGYYPTYYPTTAGGGWVQSPVSATMIYTEGQQQALANQAVAGAEAKAVEKGEAPPTQDEKDRLWDLIKGSVEGTG